MSESKTPFHNLKATSIDGEEIDFSTFKGKKVLIVNVASECGFTSQYEDLERLYSEHKDNLVVIGFPSNEFGGQEPGSDEDIKSFCTSNFGVTFPMMSKTEVKSDNRHAVYQWLTDKEKNGWNEEAPKWNFHKYLIDEEGELIGVFPSNVKPMGDEVLSKL